MSELSTNIVYNLIGKKLSGQASASELKQLDDWINSGEESKEKYEEIKSIWAKVNFSHDNTELVSQAEVNERIWNEVFEQEKEKRDRRFDSSVFLKLAAVLIIFVVALFVATELIEPPEQIPVITTITKETKSGQKSTITLQDGTIVYLNSGSKISFLSNFNDSLRIIELDGQAFFDVFKDKSKPFIVRCRNLEVEALGTTFDVNAYQNAPIQISLVTGCVRLSLQNRADQDDVFLKPGKYSIVDPAAYSFIEYGDFDAFEVLAWKEGRLIFRNESISEIIPKLELWYGVTIQIESGINSRKPFTGIFEKENLHNILMNMGGVLDFDFNIEGNLVTINKRDVPM
ncbi:MAG: FecR domain-containing protein [Cytophagales bacterium]|nr:FecR domain-containing protein [Cytophagales bacterium]